ncbi:MAG: hypothetical protein Alpg2KO_15490 [Alphaproteobacteria bacterium]
MSRLSDFLSRRLTDTLRRGRNPIEIKPGNDSAVLIGGAVIVGGAIWALTQAGKDGKPSLIDNRPPMQVKADPRNSGRFVPPSRAGDKPGDQNNINQVEPVRQTERERIRALLDNPSVVEQVGLTFSNPYRKMQRWWKLNKGRLDGAPPRTRELRGLPPGSSYIQRRDGSVLMALVGEYGSGDLLIRAAGEGRDLRGAFLAQSNLTGVGLDGKNLKDADFRRAVVGNGYFSNCDLQKADFRAARIGALSAISSDLRGADFTGATFELRQGFTVPHIDLRGCDLRGAVFSYDANFDLLDLRGAKLDDVVILGPYGRPVPNAVLTQDSKVEIRPPKPPADKDDQAAPPAP